MNKWIVLIVMMSVTAASAETVTLKSGRVIEGEIIEKTDSHVKVSNGEQEWKVRFKMMSPESAEALKQLPEKIIPEEDRYQTTGVITGMMEVISQDDPYIYITRFYDGNKEISMKKESISFGEFKEFFERLLENISGDSSFEDLGKSFLPKGWELPQPIVMESEGTIPDGEVTVYAPGGTTVKQTYKDGKLNGKSLTYGPDGKIYSEDHYKDGRPDGKSVEYGLDGKISSEMAWHKGQITRIIDYNDGKIEQEAFFQDGTMTRMVLYDAKGKIKEEWNAGDEE